MANALNGIVLRQIDRLYREGTLAGLKDDQLLERYLSRRDESAFEALVNLHGPMVLGVCRRMLRDPRDMEDAFQATFLILVRKAPAIRDPSHLSNWLYGVAYRVSVRARANTIPPISGPGNHHRKRGCGDNPRDDGTVGARPGTGPGIESIAAEVSCGTCVVLPQGTDSRPGGRGTALSRWDQPQRRLRART